MSKLVQTCSILFKLVQTCSNLSALVQTCQNLSKLLQTCQSFFKLVKICLNLFKYGQTGFYHLYCPPCLEQPSLGKEQSDRELFSMALGPCLRIVAVLFLLISSAAFPLHVHNTTWTWHRLWGV